MSLVLVSHHLCPYVQRVAIVLAEKGVPFERRNIDLANKPAWFSAISPLGKTPLLLVDDQPIFESAVICEYLEDVFPPRLHPADPLERARHRAWMEFGSTILNTIWKFYVAPNRAALDQQCRELVSQFGRVEAELRTPPFFAGTHFSVVDAVFGPIFRYFDAFARIADFGIFNTTPKVNAWRHALGARASIANAVGADYHDRLDDFLRMRHSEISRLMEQGTSKQQALA
ncbi:glutathione S-transferase family protein [Paraburkholderia aspalathi]|uniref:glutathione transferase n=1 Tax=Paraburkholderia aspalathi TaxID=1324617 RepID=A0A1I7ACQ2_9BURK|nr:glutathione S-transferase family protein [Paraburkholderia aspalathi]SFT72711.1 glutathione S-transferase [Paraburkholderia aspalathi]